MDKVVHFELPAENMERAKKFYSSVFGWSISTNDPQYFLVSTTKTTGQGMPLEPGAINGGIMKKTEKAQTPMIVIEVPSIDSYLKKIEKAGGKLVRPKVNIHDMLYYARIADSEGNIVGIVENIKH